MRLPLKTKSNCARFDNEASRRKDTPRVREAVFGDYAQIAALQTRNNLTTRSYSDWVALWEHNPVYEQLGGQFPIGWVLETNEGEIVGLIANVPFACHLRGRNLLAAAACAWAVDVGYRGHSMRLLDSLTSQKDADLIVSTTVSSNSEPALKVFEWSKVEVGKWDKSAFWITNYLGFTRSALNLKSIPLANVLSYPASAALFCRDRLKSLDGISNGSHCEIELTPDFDSRFEEFWEDLLRQNHQILLINRSRPALRWHYRYLQMRRRVWILTASTGSRLGAYAIFDRQDNEALGLKRIRLVDFQALKGFEKALPSAIHWMLRKCRREGIHVLENVGFWFERPDLPDLHPPHVRSLPSALYYYKANTAELAETFRNPAIWAPTNYDGDASL